MSVAERLTLPGMPARRADIIDYGAAVLIAFMRLSGLEASTCQIGQPVFGCDVVAAATPDMHIDKDVKTLYNDIDDAKNGRRCGSRSVLRARQLAKLAAMSRRGCARRAFRVHLIDDAGGYAI